LKQVYEYQSVSFEKENTNFDDGEVLADCIKLLLILDESKSFIFFVYDFI